MTATATRKAKKVLLCACFTLFCTFLCRHCTITTWKFIFSPLYKEREHKTFSWIGQSHFEFNHREIRQILTNWPRWNYSGEVRNSANSHECFKWRFRCCRLRGWGSFSNDDGDGNRPLPSSKNPHFQNEARCTTFLVKMSFICMRMKNHRIKGWAPIHILKQRPGGTRKWPIRTWKSNKFNEQNSNFARASRFFAHSLPSLHDYDVKMPNFTFYGGDDDFFLSSSTELKLSITSLFFVMNCVPKFRKCRFFIEGLSNARSRSLIKLSRPADEVHGECWVRRKWGLFWRDHILIRWKSINQSVSCNIAVELTVFMIGYAL